MVVWNFELCMIPLALLFLLAWNYVLIASGKDSRQGDVVSEPAFSLRRHLSLLHTHTPSLSFNPSKKDQKYPSHIQNCELILL